jgi:arylsulfatase A-like enzyme
MQYRLFSALLAALSLLGLASPLQAQMNILVVVTDDQRFDTIARMPNLANLAGQGVRFSNAYMPTPLCGPARASLFSGGYLTQNTLVLENGLPNGSFQAFDDRGNLGSALQGVGYRTAFVGKWVNGYEGAGRYVPSGWSRWVGRHSFATTTSWFGFQYTLGSSGTYASSLGSIVNSQQYTTYYERDQVLDFLDRGKASSQPFFVLWSPSAPHEPAVPASTDVGSFANFTYRDRDYTETDLRDKPWWVRYNSDPDKDDEFVRQQLRSLQGVDRSLGAIVNRIRLHGKLDNTLIVFTSDNGYMWGEHGLWGKNKAYEESVRVPLVVVMPGVAPRVEDKLVSPMIDIGPTLFQLAGVARKTDGTSLVPLLRNPWQAWRKDMFFENTASGAHTNALWAGIRNQRWKYIRYWTGEEELYDLVNDPFELNSRHRDPSLATLKNGLWTQTSGRLGLAAMPVRSFPKGRVGTRYQFQFDTWGGKAPFNWKLVSGQLPPGLTLDAMTGLLHGTPTASGTYAFAVRVTDSSYATQAKKARTFVTKPMKLTVTYF